MKIYILSYRDEHRQEPLQLAAFQSQAQAAQVRSLLTEKYKEIRGYGWDTDRAAHDWNEVLDQNQIPGEKQFAIDILRYSNFSFQVRELEVIDPTVS